MTEESLETLLESAKSYSQSKRKNLRLFSVVTRTRQAQPYEGDVEGTTNRAQDNPSSDMLIFAKRNNKGCRKSDEVVSLLSI